MKTINHYNRAAVQHETEKRRKRISFLRREEYRRYREGEHGKISRPHVSGSILRADQSKHRDADLSLLLDTIHDGSSLPALRGVQN